MNQEKESKTPIYLRWYVFVLLAVVGFFGVLVTTASLLLWPLDVVLIILRIRWSIQHCGQRQKAEPVPAAEPMDVESPASVETKASPPVAEMPVAVEAPIEAEEAPAPEVEAHVPVEEPAPVEAPAPETKFPAPIEESAESKPAVETPPKKPIIQQNQEAFDSTLNTLPRIKIKADGPKPPKDSIVMPELHYSNITKRTSFSRLGNFVVVDTETTGLSVKSNRIVEVCAVRFVNWEPVEIFETLVNPGRKISASAAAVNHITDDMVKDSPMIWQIMPELNAFIGGASIVGHNLPFDLGFLCRSGLEIGEKQRLFDTLELAKKTIKKARRVWDKDIMEYGPADDYDPLLEVFDYKLETLCEHYLICSHCNHRAAGDALATGYLFEGLARERTGTY